MFNRLFALFSFVAFLLMGGYYLNEEITADDRVSELRDLAKELHTRPTNSLDNEERKLPKKQIQRKYKRYAKNYDLSIDSQEEIEPYLISDLREYIESGSACAILEEDLNYTDFTSIRTAKQFHKLVSELNISSTDATFIEYINIYQKDDLINSLTKLSNLGHQISTYIILLYHANLLESISNQYPDYKLALELTENLQNAVDSSELQLIQAYLLSKLKSKAKAEAAVLLSQRNELLFSLTVNYKLRIIQNLNSPAKKALMYNLLERSPLLDYKKLHKGIYFIMASANSENAGLINLKSLEQNLKFKEMRSLETPSGIEWSEAMEGLNSMICTTSSNRHGQIPLNTKVLDCEIENSDLAMNQLDVLAKNKISINTGEVCDIRNIK